MGQPQQSVPHTATAANCVRTSVGTYSITLPLHPNGNTFIPNIIARTSAEAGGYYYPTIKFISPTTTTNLTAYVRNTAATPALVDGDFFFCTIP